MTAAPRIPQGTINAVLALWATHSATEIGERLGITRNKVSGIVFRHGTGKPKRKVPPPPPPRNVTDTERRRLHRKRMEGPGPGRGETLVAAAIARRAALPDIPLPEPAPPLGSGLVTFLARRHGQCAWLDTPHYGPPAGPLSMVCGRPTIGAGPYCGGHQAMARPRQPMSASPTILSG